MLDSLISIFTNYGYFAVFGILILCGFGLPVPEDITLVSAGILSGVTCETGANFWLSFKGCGQVHLMLLVSMAGVLVGDGTMFTFGRILGNRITKVKFISRLLTPERHLAVQKKFERYGSWVIFAARFMPGLRSPIFVVAGISRRVSYLRFFLTDGLAALISVPVWIYLGFWGANQRKVLMAYVHKGQIGIFIVLGCVMLALLIRWILKRRRQANFP